MCTTYYPKQACMSERELDFQPTNKKAGQSKFDQVYSAINQSYAKIYTSLNERFSPKKEDEKISEESNSDTSSSFDDLMPHFDLKDLEILEIGAYYLQRETEDMKNHLSGKELRLIMKKERKWNRIMAQGAGRPHELTEEESVFYSEEDLCLKQYALSHPRTFPQLLHEGPPMQYRWSVWKLLLRPHRFYEKGLYERLKTLPTTSEVQIKKDLHRTFPEEKYFSSQKYNKIGQKQLENVLRAISLYFNNTGGYVQGMNFLAGLLLLISGGNELESFWMFVALARDPKFLFMGLFEKDFPLLNFYVSMFYQVLEVEAPVLYHHMQKNQLPIDLWLFKWFLTIFVPTLPTKDVVRIWDLILRQGFLGIIKVAVGIVKFYDKELLHQDAYGMNLMFQSIMEDHLQKEYQENVNIMNTFNPIINIFRRNKDKNSASSSKPANVRCSFRDFDVEEVLEVAYEIDLDYEHLKELISNYETKSEDKLQEPYRKIMSNLPSPHSTVRRFKEFQNEIDSYMMRIGLRDSEKMGSELSTAEE